MKTIFCQLKLETAPGRVFTPQPATERLVDAALERIDGVPMRIADVGTGSGAIAVALAVNKPNVEIWATESGEDMGLLIGKHGHTLDALQELIRGHLQRKIGGRCLVQVDVEDYRKRRRSRVISRAREIGRRVKQSGRPEALEPMNAFERKIVHDTVGELGGLETASEGEEPARHVVVRRSSR